MGDLAEDLGDKGLVFHTEFFGFCLQVLENAFIDADMEDGVLLVGLDRRPDLFGLFF